MASAPRSTIKSGVDAAPAGLAAGAVVGAGAAVGAAFAAGATVGAAGGWTGAVATATAGLAGAAVGVGAVGPAGPAHAATRIARSTIAALQARAAARRAGCICAGRNVLAGPVPVKQPR